MAKAKELTPEAIKELKAKLEAEERTAFAEFEANMKAKREKALGAVVDPLKKERAELAASIAEAQGRIGEIDKELSGLTGEKPRKAATTGGTGKRRRRSHEDKLALAAAVHAILKTKPKERFKPSDLKAAADGIPLPDLMDLWNSSHAKGEHIQQEGEKTLSRYFVG